MKLYDWLAGGIPDLEAQREEALAKQHRAEGAIQAIKATMKWLEEQGVVGQPATPNTDDGEADGT